jgi:arylsulfatase A-like enzyme
MNMKQRRPFSESAVLCAAAIGLAIAFQPLAIRAAPAGKAEHVVIVVWDGMRPDFITQQHTPALFGLAQQGTFFKNHHPVYLSTTEVNGTAINTGMYPEHSGIIANVEYRPDIDLLKAVATEDMATVRRGDELTGSHYISVPTLAEIVQQAGCRTAVAGSKTVALLCPSTCSVARRCRQGRYGNWRTPMTGSLSRR